MLLGKTPFYDKNIDKMYEFIKYSKLEFPLHNNLSADAQDLITKLLDKDPDTRLGSKGGLNEIKSHPFFKKYNFDLITQKKAKAPFTPIIQSKSDISNFDSQFTGENPEIATAIPDSNLELIRKNQDKFKDF